MKYKSALYLLIGLLLGIMSCIGGRNSICAEIYYLQTPIQTTIGIPEKWERVYQMEDYNTNVDTAISCSQELVFINDYTKSIEKIDLRTGDVKKRFPIDLDIIPINRQVSLEYSANVIVFDNGYNLLVFDSDLKHLMTLIPDSVRQLALEDYYSYTREYKILKEKIDLILYVTPAYKMPQDTIFLSFSMPSK